MFTIASRLNPSLESALTLVFRVSVFPLLLLLLLPKRNVLISETCLGTSGFKPITCLLKIISLINSRNSTNNKIHITLRNSLFTITSRLNPSLESALTLVSRVSVFPLLLLLLLLLLLSHKRNVLISETCLGTSGFKPITCPEAKNAGQSGALTKIMILLVIVVARNARGLKCPARCTRSIENTSVDL